ncbi:MAG: hypothetical protein KDB10_04625 [Acidimicrobiales bacterium]|nr:hypothetical protein [Acidimicrobiales bacterium]
MPDYIEERGEGDDVDDAAVLWGEWWRAFNNPKAGPAQMTVACTHCGRSVGEVRSVNSCVVLGARDGAESFTRFKLVGVQGPKVKAAAARAASDPADAGLCTHHGGESASAQMRAVREGVARRQSRLKV